MFTQSVTNTETAAANTITITGDDNHAISIGSVAASYDAAESFANIKIQDGATLVYEAYFSDATNISFPDGLSGTKGNDMVITITAGATDSVLSVVYSEKY